MARRPWGSRTCCPWMQQIDIEDVSQRPAMGRKRWCRVTHRPTSRLATPLICIDLPAVVPYESFHDRSSSLPFGAWQCGKATARFGTNGSQ
eukprot:2648519-Amphidinium_carterae.2